MRQTDTVEQIIADLKRAASVETWDRFVANVRSGKKLDTGRFHTSDDGYCIIGLCLTDEMLTQYMGALTVNAAEKLAATPSGYDPFWDISMRWDTLAETLGIDEATRQVREYVGVSPS